MPVLFQGREGQGERTPDGASGKDQGLRAGMNGGTYRGNAIILSLIVMLWAIKSIRYTFDPQARDIGSTVSGLLAGIVLVDWLAVADASRNFGFVFVALFGLAWLLQKVVPAT